MSEKIKPALSADEWRELGTPMGLTLGDHLSVEVAFGAVHVDSEFGRLGAPAEKWVAIANAALPDSDPRKITRDMVTLLRRIAYTEVAEEDGEGSYDSANLFEGKEMDALMELADALASYLPPEGT